MGNRERESPGLGLLSPSLQPYLLRKDCPVHLTAKPLPSLLLPWTKSKAPSTSEPTVYRLPYLMISGRLRAVHRSCSLDRQSHVLTSPGERGLDPSLGLQGLTRKRTSGALKPVKLAPAWAQRGAFPQAKWWGAHRASRRAPLLSKQHNFMPLN